LKTIYIIAILMAALGIVGAIDYEEALNDELHYCEMVKSGAWPAYKPEVDCKEYAK
jgi:hypothetical protein